MEGARLAISQADTGVVQRAVSRTARVPDHLEMSSRGQKEPWSTQGSRQSARDSQPVCSGMKSREGETKGGDGHGKPLNSFSAAKRTEKTSGMGRLTST